jgi:hypothetical protein
MKKTTPFKSPEDFEKELTDFSNKHKITLAEHSKRISEYFEMTCYNLVVRYYEKLGYELTVQNLKGGMFKYKCSPTGFLQNFSYFKASKDDEQDNNETVYIFHNATAQSAFDENVFTTPDIVVSKTDTPSESTDYYPTAKMKLTFISKDDLVTFCEAKHFSPFPELMINFVGTVHELKPECLDDEVEHPVSAHLAPTLMMSGTFGKPTGKIKESLEKRYYVNYFDNLFDVTANAFFTKKQMAEVATLGRKAKKVHDFDLLIEEE